MGLSIGYVVVTPQFTYNTTNDHHEKVIKRRKLISCVRLE